MLLADCLEKLNHSTGQTLLASSRLHLKLSELSVRVSVQIRYLLLPPPPPRIPPPIEPLLKFWVRC